MAKPRTLFDKIWDSHLVDVQEDGTCLLYIDRHLVHEVTSPQAFEGLRMAGRPVRRPEATLAVADHNVPTTDRTPRHRRRGIAHPGGDAGRRTAPSSASQYFSMDDLRQGIVHIIGPEQGFTLPGMTIVCGDSHTATHGAFGALAFGIGTSEVEHVLATQTLLQKPAKNMRVTVEGALPPGVGAKDLILAIIGEIGTAGGTGHVIEYAGEAIRGARHGRPDDRLQHDDRGGRPRRPDRARRDHLRLSARAGRWRPRAALGAGGRLLADPAVGSTAPSTTRRSRLDAAGDRAAGHLGHQPRGRGADHRRRSRSRGSGERRASAGRCSARCSTWAWRRARGCRTCASTACSSARAPTAASRICARRPGVARGRKVADGVGAMVVPGSGLVKSAGRSRGARPHLPRGGLRVAGARLLDVPRHERRPAGARRALRVHLQPQLRGPAGPRRPHPPDEPGDGRGRRRHRPARRRARSRRLTGRSRRARSEDHRLCNRSPR